MDGHCPVHTDQLLPDDKTPCPREHEAWVCPECQGAWIGASGHVLCVGARHLLELHADSLPAADLRKHIIADAGTLDPDKWCHHDPEGYKSVVALGKGEVVT